MTGEGKWQEQLKRNTPKKTQDFPGKKARNMVAP